jgi:hypothetical protein
MGCRFSFDAAKLLSRGGFGSAHFPYARFNGVRNGSYRANAAKIPSTKAPSIEDPMTISPGLLPDRGVGFGRQERSSNVTPNRIRGKPCGCGH